MKLDTYVGLAYTLHVALDNNGFGNPRCEGAARILAYGLNDIQEAFIELSEQVEEDGRKARASDPQTPPYQRLLDVWNVATPEYQKQIVDLLEQEQLKPSKDNSEDSHDYID